MNFIGWNYFKSIKNSENNVKIFINEMKYNIQKKKKKKNK